MEKKQDIYVPEYIQALIKEEIWTTASGLSLAINVQRKGGSMYTLPEIMNYCEAYCPDLDNMLH